MMMTTLRKAMILGLLRPLDVHFAGLMAQKGGSAYVQLAAALVSRETGAGHVCLPVDRLQPHYLFAGHHELVNEMWQAAGEPEQSSWIDLLESSSAVGNGTVPTPLVLQHGRLYLYRMWKNEGTVARFFSNSRTEVVDESHAGIILDTLFGSSGSDSFDGQKVAAAIALTSNISIISGGPGTGKTATVARLLVALMRLSKARLRILLAAPTGKAAARLTESLNMASRLLSLTEQERELFPQKAVTLHRLLGVGANNQQPRYNRASLLSLDVMVVDEAAMVDLLMMARLIEALPAHARIILLGDREQLASVEAGAVFGDICQFIEWGYGMHRAQQLMRLTGCSLQGHTASRTVKLPDNLCLLRKSWRFDELSGIGQLAKAVNAGDSQAAFSILKGSLRDISSHLLVRDEDYQVLLQTSVCNYEYYLASVKACACPAEILMIFNRYRLLCALREGPFGVRGLNERILQLLQHKGLIRLPVRGYEQWYGGRPVMISRNNADLGLFNGDIGIALCDQQGVFRVWFQLPDGSLKSVHCERLPQHETAWAMTVHKSQGSEFDSVALVLPDYVSPVVTRELVYTAITRARQHLTVYASEQVFTHAIRTPTQRYSGMVDSIINYPEQLPDQRSNRAG